MAFADFFDLPEGPRFAPIDATQLEAVRGMLGKRAPLVTVPVRAVEFTPARFGTGSTLRSGPVASCELSTAVSLPRARPETP